MIGDWISDENVRPFVEVSAHLVGYPLDDSDWIAISFGIRDSGNKEEDWYQYDLSGDRQLKLSFHWDRDGGIVSVRVESDADTESKLQVAITIMGQYAVLSELPKDWRPRPFWPPR